MTKTFVLEPSAVLASANSTLRFGDDNVIVIPMAVIDEVNSLKNLSIEQHRIRQEIMDYILSFDQGTLTSIGVRQSNGSLLKIAKNFSSENIGILDKDLYLTQYQKRMLKVCVGLKKQGKNVVLVTNNPGLLMRAPEIGIKAEKFKDETFPRLEEQYTGRLNVTVTLDEMNAFYKQGYCNISAIDSLKHVSLVQNEYVVMERIRNDGATVKAYGKVSGDKILQIMMHERAPYDVKPMNDGQVLALNALYDDAPLTIIKGDAGTGKTFCTLAVALDEIQSKKYTRILATRKADFSQIGYLPGEIENKMAPYLAGIRDNLSILIGANKKEKNTSETEDGRYYFERGIIKIQAIELLRGRSIVDTLFIIDETQNIEPELIKTIVTRAAAGSKFVFLGDPSQIDNPALNERHNGLVYLSERMKGAPYCVQVTLSPEESVRSDLARFAAQNL